MKITERNVKLAWKSRRTLWKYRCLIRRRREIAGVAVAALAIGACVVAHRALRA